MVRIQLEKVGKRYRREWIFRNIDLEMKTGQSWALLGHNGSGKSTLMRVLCGHLTPTKGKCRFFEEEKEVASEKVYQYISLAAPYIELIEEFTLKEAIQFHAKFKPFYEGIDAKEILDILQLPGAKNKEIRFFSSGMKQRLKLLLAFASNTPILFLDEPTTNLDTQGVNWYKELVSRFSNDRLTIIASNVEADYDFCDHHFKVTDYK
ncbi:MAG: ABC transporter ATP-binding protein [Bacteroidetes bacterium]|nr:ABC transporter ATP-binding protein [Bacteroidota bacterium]